MSISAPFGKRNRGGHHTSDARGNPYRRRLAGHVEGLFQFASGSFTQAWSNPGLIILNDDWSGVPSIEVYLGQDITTATGTDPRTLTTDSTLANDLDVIANQTNTAINNGGVAEFDGIADPTVALQGSGTADAPYLILYLDASGRQDVRVQSTSSAILRSSRTRRSR